MGDQVAAPIMPPPFKAAVCHKTPCRRNYLGFCTTPPHLADLKVNGELGNKEIIGACGQIAPVWEIVEKTRVLIPPSHGHNMHSGVTHKPRESCHL